MNRLRKYPGLSLGWDGTAHRCISHGTRKPYDFWGNYVKTFRYGVRVHIFEHSSFVSHEGQNIFSINNTP